ncbi:unnamed protein product, partial [Choristocarpus tenellus]
ELKQSGRPEVVRAVAINSLETNAVVGTSRGKVFEVAMDSGTTLLLVPGPGTGPDPKGGTGCGALAHSPKDPDRFASGGADGVLRIWSVRGHCVLASLEVGVPGTEKGKLGSSIESSHPPAIGALAWSSG